MWWRQGRNYRGCSRCGCTWARGVSGPKIYTRRPTGPPFPSVPTGLSIASNFLGYAYVLIRAGHNQDVLQNAIYTLEKANLSQSFIIFWGKVAIYNKVICLSYIHYSNYPIQ